MRASRFLIATLKETPSDAEIVSHQLMLRAGMIRKLASGFYTWLPLGLRVLRKVEAIVREEMDKSGGQEVLMPVIQPAELWEESGRLQQYGPELMQIEDRHGRAYCLGPTHEEVITDLIRHEISSYKQLPANFYQIQTKFRDEIRPRFGVMRSREFLMKDAYSFHLTPESLKETYDIMHQTYCNIFTRIGLDFRSVQADSGSIGGSYSHEFHVLAQSGEDAIAISTESEFAANVEKAEAITADKGCQTPTSTLEEVPTPGQRTIADVANYLSIAATQMVKTLIVLGESDTESDTKSNEESPLLALVLRGDHELNGIKAAKLDGVACPLTFATAERIEKEIGCNTGSLGPVGLTIPTIVDRSAAVLVDFACGANKDGYHLNGVNWGRDVSIARTEDLRNVVVGDPSPDGKGHLEIKRGIEVGHIFDLGTKYSETMKAHILNEQGKEQALTMGCYGIGLSRIVAAAIEQGHDDRGIIWPDAIAPFQIAIIPINMHKSTAVAEKCEQLYRALQAQGYDTLLMDEAKTRVGAMLADVELTGIPHRIVVSDRGLEKGTLEYKGRRDENSQDIATEQLLTFLGERIAKQIASSR